MIVLCSQRKIWLPKSPWKLRALGFCDGYVPTAVNEGKAAIVLGVKPSTLANWRRTGRYNLPFIKSGRLVRYRVADLAAWIASRRPRTGWPRGFWPPRRYGEPGLVDGLRVRPDG